MTGRVVLDNRGYVWDAHSPKLALSLGSPIAGEALVDFVVRNLGYVALDRVGASARVRLRPAIAARRAIDSLIQQLRERPLERVMVSAFDGSWQHELRPVQLAMRRIGALQLQVEHRERQRVALTRW
jgi:hypothetical protein